MLISEKKILDKLQNLTLDQSFFGLEALILIIQIKPEVEVHGAVVELELPNRTSRPRLTVCTAGIDY